MYVTGECPAGTITTCNTAYGYASCDQECQNTMMPGAMINRGGYVRSTSCGPYFDCDAGFYTSFSPNGIVSCQACLSNRPSDSIWVTSGLSFNDETSCLWECVKQRARWDGTTGKCMILNRPTPTNQPGFYSLPSISSCGIGWTSERVNAITQDDCVPCPRLVTGAQWVMNNFICEWECTTGKRIGGVCSQEIEEMAFPWQAAGHFKIGIGIKSHIITSQSQRPKTSTNISITTRMYGRYNRYSIQINQTNVIVPGPICSYSVASGYIYVIFCNHSFIGYINMRDKTQQRFGILIGNTTRGWHDGFRTEALFQSELYISGEMDSNILFVIDRWNCVLREVTISTPGGYLTRVDTIYGNTERFIITNTPKCYGAGSLKYPRQLWPMYGSKHLCFVDDDRMYTLNGQTRRVTIMFWKTDILSYISNVDDINGCIVPDTSSVILSLSNGSGIELVASSMPCIDDYTSLSGEKYR